MQILLDREALHRIPELSFDLPKTTAYVKHSLSALGCQVFSPIDGAVCAWFDFGRDDAIAFRADMDALPVTETTGAAYASTHPGRMHACGHDGHTATLLELARRLDTKESLKHNVLLIFQPAEETFGGAKPICDTGILDTYNVQAIFGLHLWPGVPKGVVASRKGAMMSLSGELTVDVTGQSAHISKPHEGKDALWAAMEFYRRARALEASLPPEIPRLLNFGKMESGTVRNVISNHTHLEGTLRTFDSTLFDSMHQQLLQFAREIEADTLCGFTVSLSDGYPALLNPEDLYDRVNALYPLFELPEPNMGTEDFSWYQQYVPGLFFFLGVGDTPALHSGDFDFDSNVLLKGAELFEHIAEEF